MWLYLGAVAGLVLVVVVTMRRLKAAEQARDEAAQLLSEARKLATGNYATGYGHGLDEGYRKAEQQAETERRKRAAQAAEWDGQYRLN